MRIQLIQYDVAGHGNTSLPAPARHVVSKGPCPPDHTRAFSKGRPSSELSASAQWILGRISDEGVAREERRGPQGRPPDAMFSPALLASPCVWQRKEGDPPKRRCPRRLPVAPCRHWSIHRRSPAQAPETRRAWLEWCRKEAYSVQPWYLFCCAVKHHFPASRTASLIRFTCPRPRPLTSQPSSKKRRI